MALYRIEDKVKEVTVQCFKNVFNSEVPSDKITINEPPKDFDGDLTLVVFPLLRFSGKNPEETGKAIGEYLVANCEEIKAYNVVKGFLNLSISDAYWLTFFNEIFSDPDFGKGKPKAEKVLIEFSSPNTNKPLHLGHIRNNVLGVALNGLLQYDGYDVSTCCLVNDRGIHICKSMLAWKKFGHGETPESSGLKGDKLVGKYYVEFDKHYKQEIAGLIAKDMPEKEAEKNAPLIREAQEMLLKWEAGDKETVDLWKKMNAWVYSGFEQTYKRFGTSFDKYYYESETYLLGKDSIQEGLEKGIFFKKEDNSVWIDLTADGLDQKLVLRSDGTSVYISQDIGTADLKYHDFKMDRSILVVGNEQDYHFKVLKLILQKLGQPHADGLHHFSYGMVDLPSGKMKSREGTVVDADDLVEEMISTARQMTQELGKIDGFTKEEAEKLYETIGLGALKFYLLRVDPKKRILFDPKESIDLHGYTGPFVQYTYARVQSVLRKYRVENSFPKNVNAADLAIEEKELIQQLYKFPDVVAEAARDMNPARIVDFAYDIAKTYNKFYANCPIISAPEKETVAFRAALSAKSGEVIKDCFSMLGINVPDRM